MGLDNPLHIAFLVVILLLVFGARRLPEIGRSLGSGMREFKQSITGETPEHQPQQPTLNPGTERQPTSSPGPEQQRTSGPPPEQQSTPERVPVATEPSEKSPGESA